MKTIGFFQDPTGDFSIMRLTFFLGMLWAMGLTTGMAISGQSIPLLIALFTALAGVFTGLKLIQNQQEKDKKPLDNTN